MLVVRPTIRPARIAQRDELDALAGLCEQHELGADRRRGVRRLRARCRRRRVSDSADARRRADVRPGRAVEIARPAAGEAGVDRGRRARGAVAPPRSTRLELIADTYLSVSTPVQARRAGLLRARASVRDADPRPRRAESTRVLAAAGARIPACELLPRGRRLDGGDSRAGARARKRALVLDLLDEDACSFIRATSSTFREEAYLVVSLLPEPDVFRRTVERVLSHASAAPDVLRPLMPPRPLLGRRPGSSCRCSRCARRAAGASARSAISRRCALAAAPGFACSRCCRSTRWRRQTSPYSALSAMAIDPLYIALDDVPEFQALGGERCRSPTGGARSTRCASTPRGRLRGGAAIKEEALRARSSTSATTDWRRTTRARAARFAAYIVEEQLVAGRLRAVPRAARAATARAPWTSGPALRRRDPAALDRCAGGAGRQAVLLPPVPAVARRRAVAGRARARRAPSRSSAICRSWSAPTAPTCGRARRCSARRVGRARRPMRSARPARTGACPCIAGTRWPPRISLAARPRPPQRATVRRLSASITWSASIAPTRGRRSATDARRFDAAPTSRSQRRARRAACSRVFRESPARADHRRGSRHGARLRARVARGAAGARLQGAALGARVAQRRPAVPRPGDYPATSLATTGTHDTDPLADWWDTTADEERARHLPPCRACAMAAAVGDRRSTTTYATR